jgi:hypothetical protein
MRQSLFFGDLGELMHRENEDVGGKRLKLSKGDPTATTVINLLCLCELIYEYT